MQIAILTFDGFNEIDSFVSINISIGYAPGLEGAYHLASEFVTSMNGVIIQAQRRLDFVGEADAVIIGSGVKSLEIAKDPMLLGQIRVDPKRQLVAAQCSGTLLLAKVGLLEGRRACTDVTTSRGLFQSESSLIRLSAIEGMGPFRG